MCFASFGILRPHHFFQEDLFLFSEGRILQSFLTGYNGTVLVYGQTSSGIGCVWSHAEILCDIYFVFVPILHVITTYPGKTHTVFGTTNKPGLVPRTIDFLFDNLPVVGGPAAEAVSGVVGSLTVKSVELVMQVYEIYCEQVFDLMAETIAGMNITQCMLAYAEGGKQHVYSSFPRCAQRCFGDS